ncbi:TonB-dependent receptor plug domain-containing protein [Thermonema rossianum]|uniref:TonB-dependent receptor plug domain-containing protein n=1 Tax=Thermonema rossianum TaxID=55505 RepID=UPI00056E5229|nr:TonB-dependent receptor [Thermonema rossianum]
MKERLLLWISGVAVVAHVTQAQQLDSLMQEYELQEVVVSASRLQRELHTVSVPIHTIDAEDIRRAGYLRLQDALQEQTGLQLVYDHGTGLQMQGLDADYTLIMIDGEPLIGRTAGTFDLSRLNITDIKRIEIMRGPSSAIYGSEALAGVINIITEEDEEQPWRLSGMARYGSRNTSNFQLKATTTSGKLHTSWSANYYGSQGYDYTPDTYGQTASPFVNYTLRGGVAYDPSPAWRVHARARLYEDFVKDAYESAGERFDGKGYVADKNVYAAIEWMPTGRAFWQLRNYFTTYHTAASYWQKDSGEEIDHSFFRQLYWRPELFTEHDLGQGHTLSGGVGTNRELVSATRYEGTRRMHNLYAYVQHEWSRAERWHMHTGARFDQHSIYGAQLSPKWGIRYNQDRWSLRMSVGRGYKAPDFRQLYLNFTNNAAGYTVLGTEEVRQGMEQLLTQGLIAEILIPPAEVASLKPERSWALNIGGEWRPLQNMKVDVNLFRNILQDMIDTQPVARKNNGQFVYSYRNLHEVITQGVELNVEYKPSPYWRLSAGYQYLDAFEPSVKERIRAGEIYKRDAQTLASRRVKLEEYGGLFNRSRHSANFKAFYTHSKWEATMRLIYRGRYGWGDANGNLILDDASEYVDGYLLCNVSAACHLRHYTLQAGVDNLTDFRNETFIPALPPRTLWLSFQFNFSTNKK